MLGPVAGAGGLQTNLDKPVKHPRVHEVDHAATFAARGLLSLVLLICLSVDITFCCMGSRLQSLCMMGGCERASGVERQCAIQQFMPVVNKPHPVNRIWHLHSHISVVDG